MALLNNKESLIGIQDCLDAIDAKLEAVASKTINQPIMSASTIITASGWDKPSGTNSLYLAESLSNKVVKIELPALSVGATLKSVVVKGNIVGETATTTLTAQLYRVYMDDGYQNREAVSGASFTVNAEDHTDSNTELNSSNAILDDLALEVGADDSFYIQITATTDTDGTVSLACLSVEVEEA